MKSKEIYQSIDQTKLKKVEGGEKAIANLKRVEKETKGFTVENPKFDVAMGRLYDVLKEKNPQVLKNVKVEEKVKEVKVPTTKTEQKKDPKKKTKTVKKKVKKATGKKKVSKPTKTPSTPKERKVPFSTRAKQLADKEGISFKEARAKLSKQIKEESKKIEKSVKSDLDKLLAFVKSKKFEDGEKYPKTYGQQNPQTSSLSADAKRMAKPVGKRKSKNGKTYYEYRDNRSDRNSLPAPQGQYKYKGEAPPYLEAGGTLPTPFGQAGLVGETGTMNEADLFAMGGGLPQGVHQYYANTYNPAYSTPHGYAKGGEITVEIVDNFDEQVGYKKGTPLNVVEVDEDDYMITSDGRFLSVGEVEFADQKSEENYYKIINSRLAKGGKLEAEWLVVLKDDDGFELDEVVFAKNEDEAMVKAEKLNPNNEGVLSVMMLTDYDGKKIQFAKGGMMQGYNDKLDESLGNRNSVEPLMMQSYKDRRDESKGMEKAMGRRAYQSVGTMDKKAKVGDKVKLIKGAGSETIFRNFPNGEYEVKKVKKGNKSVPEGFYEIENKDGNKTQLATSRFETKYAKGGKIEVGKKYSATFSNKFKKRVPTKFEVISKFKGRDNMPMVEILTEDGRRANVFEKDLKPLMFAKGGVIDAFNLQFIKDVPKTNLKVEQIDNKISYAKGGSIKVGDKVKYPKATMVGKVKSIKDSDFERTLTIEYDDGKIINEGESSVIKFAKGGRTKSATNRDRKYYNSSESWEKSVDSKGRKRPTYKKRKSTKSQGYNDRLDESLGETRGAKKTKKQSYKSRRKESEGMQKSMGRRKYSRVKTMDKGNREKRMPKKVKVFKSPQLSTKTKQMMISEDGRKVFIFENGMLYRTDSMGNKTQGQKMKETQYEVLSSESFADGGKIGFDALSKKVAKRYYNKAVPKKFQKQYGKTYSKSEAMEVGKKVAGKVYRQQQLKN